MPRSAASIIAAALQIAKQPLYQAQALDELNSLLRFIEDTVNLAAACGAWNFYFNTQLVNRGAGNIIQTAGVPLPIDYLRVQGWSGASGAQRSSKWYLMGVPYDMIEVDLAEFDDQVQQAGIQSYPYFWTKDLSQYQPIIEITGNLNPPATISGLAIITDAIGNATGAPLSSIVPGMSIAGGIGPLSVITPGTVVATVAGAPPNTLTLTSPTTDYPPITSALTGASLLIGNPGLGLMYPPPSGAFPAMIRYQRRMPRLTQTQVTAGAYPWLSDNDIALVDGLAGLVMRYSDDQRVAEYIGAGLGSGEGRFGQHLAKYLKQADDNANRAVTVQLDRRQFGRSFSSLKNTKRVGW